MITYKLIECPNESKPIGYKWVFWIKLRSDGLLEKCKAHLVAKVLNQVEGINYTYTFSHMVNHQIVRNMVNFAITNDWPMKNLDVSNAFLSGDLH